MFTLRELTRSTSTIAPLLAVATLTAVVALARPMVDVGAQEKAQIIPAPVVDQATASIGSDVAVFAGGCFWGVQGVFQHVKGVTSAVSGYAGGEMKNAEYESVSSGRTGHAEAVRVTYDPRQVSYGRLLQVYFSVVHDPTQLNRQGPDVGTQYRSTIFPLNAEQERVATAYIAQLNQSKVYKRTIATTLERDRSFYPAESYHQDFLARNPRHPYIVYNDLPKVGELERLFPELYRSTPALVGTR